MRLTISGLAGAIAVLLVAAPLTSAAQQAGQTPRIGVLLGALPEDGPYAEAFRQGLRQFGYEEGRNVAVEWRWARGEVSRLPDLAQELVRLNVDIIVANSNLPIQAAQRATKTIPIVMVYPLEPVAAGFVASFARPGGNITGLTLEFPELHGKRLQLLKEAIPKLSRAAILWDPALPVGRQRVKEAETAAPALGLRLQVVGVRGRSEFQSAFTAMTRERAGAIYLTGSPMLFAERTQVAAHAIKHRLPMMCGTRDYVEAGCLMGYGVSSFTVLFQRAAYYVDRILKGARPGDLPVEQPTKFDLMINMKTARALGLALPPAALLRADQVIE